MSEASSENRDYYDAFSSSYDVGRDRGYHQLIDDQAAALVERVGAGRRLLEVGCGTGLVLSRTAKFAAHAEGVDLSPGMLAGARARGLTVREADCTQLPFEDGSFDVAYSFKVLAHVPEFDRALAEMIRVVRVGGHVVFDIYNRHSIRHAIKRVFGPRKTSRSFDEAAISTRFSTPREMRQQLPPELAMRASAGIRVITPHPAILQVPLVGRLTRRLEWRLMDSACARYAGFWVVTAERIR